MSRTKENLNEYQIIVYRNPASYCVSTDWVAIDDDRYDGQETDPIGHGRTAIEAIKNLFEQFDEKTS